jgi:hypothetical protein
VGYTLKHRGSMIPPLNMLTYPHVTSVNSVGMLFRETINRISWKYLPICERIIILNVVLDYPCIEYECCCLLGCGAVWFLNRYNRFGGTRYLHVRIDQFSGPPAHPNAISLSQPVSCPLFPICICLFQTDFVYTLQKEAAVFFEISACICKTT